MLEPTHLIGWPGIASGIGVFVVAWCVLWRTTRNKTFELTKAFLENILPMYLDIAKFIMGLAAGGIVLTIGSTTLRPSTPSTSPSTPHLPANYASPLFLLAMSMVYGIVFMPLLATNYEAFTANTWKYDRWRYVRNRTVGYSALICFCLGYGWLIWAAAQG
jgi:hypothetical protein